VKGVKRSANILQSVFNLDRLNEVHLV